MYRRHDVWHLFFFSMYPRHVFPRKNSRLAHPSMPQVTSSPHIASTAQDSTAQHRRGKAGFISLLENDRARTFPLFFLGLFVYSRSYPRLKAYAAHTHTPSDSANTTMIRKSTVQQQDFLREGPSVSFFPAPPSLRTAAAFISAMSR